MLSRRQFIRNAGLGSAGLALTPYLQHMRAHAAGDATRLPKRFVFFTTANGINPGYLNPELSKGDEIVLKPPDDVDRIVDQPLSSVGLPTWLSSLQPLVNRATCITGLSGKMCRGWHTVSYGTLGCYASGDKGKPLGETIDGALCKAFPSIFPHIGVSCNRANGVSAVGSGSPLPTYKDPVEVYNTLFGVISDDPRAQRRNRYDGHLVDFMSSDVKIFEDRLPAEERHKLAHYRNSFEQMSVRHRQLLAKRDEIRRLNPQTPVAGEMLWEDKVEAMCDMIAQAMIAGLTNVAAINTDGNGANGAMYGRRCGFDSPKGGHGFGHSAAVQRIGPFGFNVSMMAEMALTLDAVPEGDGTMLDNTLLVMVSTSGDTHHTRCVNFPMVLIGNLGGKLRMGRHIQVPGYGKPENRTIGTMYTTILDAAGLPREGFGQLDISTSRENQVNPLSELLT